MLAATAYTKGYDNMATRAPLWISLAIGGLGRDFAFRLIRR